MDKVTEEALDEARRVCAQYYQQWYEDAAKDLAEQVMRGDIEDEEALDTALHEYVDGAVLYTKDQALIRFVADDASGEVEDMGGGGDQPEAAYAYCALRRDIYGALDRMGLGGGRSGWGGDRDAWVIEVARHEHGDELAVLWDKLLERGVVDPLKPLEEEP